MEGFRHPKQQLGKDPSQDEDLKVVTETTDVCNVVPKQIIHWGNVLTRREIECVY